MFADDVGLLPGHMFTRMLEQARRTPAHFADLADDLFRVMARGGRVGFETVDWFNGGLFDDATALPLERSDIDTVLAASRLDWSEIDPSILGTLFERGLDPGKRAQLGAHYTDRDKIMLLVEPVVIRPWLAEWATEKAEIAAELERAEATKSTAARTKRRNEAERRYRAFLNRLRAFTVLDPACGSGQPAGSCRQWSGRCRARAGLRSFPPPPPGELTGPAPFSASSFFSRAFPLLELLEALGIHARQSSQPRGSSCPKVIEELRCGGNARDEQMIPSPRAGNVE